MLVYLAEADFSWFLGIIQILAAEKNKRLGADREITVG